MEDVISYDIATSIMLEDAKLDDTTSSSSNNSSLPSNTSSSNTPSSTAVVNDPDSTTTPENVNSNSNHLHFSPLKHTPNSNFKSLADDLSDPDELPARKLFNNSDELAPAERKLCKSVSFQDGERFVHFVPPPNPWENSPPFTRDDVLNAYKLTCEKHGVRPFSKVLAQLRSVSQCDDSRYELLSLKGERLDNRHCETLEEIFKRFQFRYLDLEGTHLEEEGASAVFEMIEYYESAHELCISGNRNIGPRGWQACAYMLRKTAMLSMLDMRSCTIPDEVMPFIGRALKFGSQLTILHLENCNLSGRGLLILVAALKMNELLEELYLADNRLMPSDGIQVGSLLKCNRALSLLDLRTNHFQDVGLTHISEGLKEQKANRGLKTLVLWHNQVTHLSMEALARALMINKSLETLNLGHNTLTNEGLHSLKDGLLRNRVLLRIGLQSCHISCEGAVALAEYIAETPCLIRIDLRENDVKTGGLMALALAMRMNQSVTRIDLDKDSKREPGLKDYAEQQQIQKHDIETAVSRNRKLHSSANKLPMDQGATQHRVVNTRQPVSGDATIANEQHANDTNAASQTDQTLHSSPTLSSVVQSESSSQDSAPSASQQDIEKDSVTVDEVRLTVGDGDNTSADELKTDSDV